MSERSTGGAFAVASFAAIDFASRFSAPARNVGLAYETPFSLLQSLAMRPQYDPAIIAMKIATTTSETMPTVSWRMRRQARAQRPGDSCIGGRGGFRRTALMNAPYLNETRGSTTLYITSTSRLMSMVMTARYTVTALMTGKSLRFTAVMISRPRPGIEKNTSRRNEPTKIPGSAMPTLV